MKEKDKISSVLIGISIILVLSGIVASIWYLSDLSNNFNIISSTASDVEKTGQVGDFIGGVVGSLWALAGVILLFLTLRINSKQFALQQKEMKLQRSEMQLNRITDLVKNQREMLNSYIDQFELKIPNSSGGTKLNALYYINTYVREYFYSDKDMSNLNEKEEILYRHLNSFITSQRMVDFTRDYQYSLGILSKLMENYNEEFEEIHKQTNKSGSKYLNSLITISLNIQQLNYVMNSCKMFHLKKNEYLISKGGVKKMVEIDGLIKNYEKANKWAKDLCAHEIRYE